VYLYVFVRACVGDKRVCELVLALCSNSSLYTFVCVSASVCKCVCGCRGGGARMCVCA